ncbi:MAG TPA: hypothetical protein PKX23_19040 [Verrucomicrobiota bacterium]|nr:hypothetical protein [Verrucomicrobiota bacterium]
MKNRSCSPIHQSLIATASGVALALLSSGTVRGYEYYSDPNTGTGMCYGCHGDFRGPGSTKGTVFPNNNKHDMHRNASWMGTACNLCHTGDSSTRFPTAIGRSNGTANNPAIGCNGCHEPLGLRKHHRINGVTSCATCHPNDGTPPPETTKPPYYGTADTKARNPANDVLLSNTNENWSVGDFLGLDNDGNNHYDLADYAVGPYRILSTTRQGDNLVVTWLTAGGRTNTVQKASSLSAGFSDLSSRVFIAGVGLVTNSYVDIGGATNGARFYRMKSVVP